MMQPTRRHGSQRDRQAWQKLSRLRRAWFVTVVPVLVMIGGCIQPIQPPAPTPSLPLLDLTQASTNRLLVLGTDGNVFTVNPDGTTRLDLTTDADTGRVYSQPTWSPTGEQIAWAEANATAGEVSGALITSGADGNDRTRTEVPFPPFYLYWSPDSKQVAYLSNWKGSNNKQTIALHLVDIAAGAGEAKTLAVGQPFYFSWAPDSTQLVTHIGNERVGLLALDGSETVLAEHSANFAAPQWSADGSRLLYGVHQNDTPLLVLTDTTGEVQQVVTFFALDAGAAFSLSPTGEFIAYTETSTQVGANSFGPLFIADLAKEEFEQLSADPVLAFFWNPAGDTLLFMSVEFEGDMPWLRLQVWDGNQTRKLNRFIPSDVFFSQYLPFADQYAQSMQVWSPDGSAIVYSGRSEYGDHGIWVHTLEADKPVKVAEGVFATWSPQ